MPGNFFQFLVHSLLLLSLGLSVRRPAQRDKSLQKLVQVQHFSWPTIIHNRHMPCVTAQYHAHDHVPNIMRTTMCPILCARPRAQCYVHSHMPNVKRTTTCPMLCAQPRAQYHAHNRAFCRLGDKALRQLVTSQPALLSYTPTTLASNLTAMGECLVRECLCALNGEW